MARLARANIRPLLLSPSGKPPSVAKRVYDFIGIFFTVSLVNFSTIPFMLLSLETSAEAWRRAGWYGLYLVFGGLVFFYAGGQSWLKGIHRRKQKEGTLYIDVKANGATPVGRSTATSVPAAVSTLNAGPGAYPPGLEQIYPPKD